MERKAVPESPFLTRDLTGSGGMNAVADAIVMGGSRGIGRAIAESLADAGCGVVATSSRQLDTSDLDSVRRFVRGHGATDILVLNTGGPPAKKFDEVTEEDWAKYHNQLFLGFCLALRGITVRDGGYIFLISSGVVREPNPALVISGAYRAAFSSVFKVLSREYAKREVSCISIAPGLIETDRTRDLLAGAEDQVAALPMGRMGRPSEIGGLVRGIVENKVKYLSGVTINVDGASSGYVF